MCSSCKRNRAIDEYEEGYLCCIQCVGYKRKYNERHKEKVNQTQRTWYEKNEEYREHILKMRSERGKQIVSCSVCSCSMSQAHYHRHRKTEKHKINFEKSLVSLEWWYYWINDQIIRWKNGRGTELLCKDILTCWCCYSLFSILLRESAFYQFFPPPPELKLYQWTEDCSNWSAPVLNCHASTRCGRICSFHCFWLVAH